MIDIDIEMVEVKRRSRKLGGLRRNGTGASIRKAKRSLVHMIWRFHQYPDHSYIIYPEFKQK